MKKFLYKIIMKDCLTSIKSNLTSLQNLLEIIIVRNTLILWKKRKVCKN